MQSYKLLQLLFLWLFVCLNKTYWIQLNWRTCVLLELYVLNHVSIAMVRRCWLLRLAVSPTSFIARGKLEYFNSSCWCRRRWNLFYFDVAMDVAWVCPGFRQAIMSGNWWGMTTQLDFVSDPCDDKSTIKPYTIDDS